MLLMGKSTIPMAIFHSFLINYQMVNLIKIPLNPIKPPFSHSFLLVYQRVTMVKNAPKKAAAHAMIRARSRRGAPEVFLVLRVECQDCSRCQRSWAFLGIDGRNC